MSKTAILAFFDAGSRKCDFRLPHVFNETGSLSDFKLKVTPPREAGRPSRGTP